MKKEIVLRIMVLTVIFALCIPLVTLIVKYVDLYIGKDKFTSLEITEDTAVRYKYDASADSSLSEALNSPRTEIGRYSGNVVSLDDYYNEIYEEYRFKDADADIDDFYNQSLKLYNNDQSEIDEISSLMQSGTTVQVIGDEDDQLLANIDNLKILHSFDGTALAENKIKESEREILKNLDREGIEAYINEKYVTKYRRDVSSLMVYVQNKFYTSPIPSIRKKNHKDELDDLKLIIGKDRYFSFEIIKFSLVAKSSINLRDLKIFVMRDNYVFPNVGGENDSFFKYKDKTIYSTLALGYNPSPGKYKIVVKSKSNPGWKGLNGIFTLMKRKVPRVKKGFSVVNLERTTSLKNIRIKGPNDQIGGYENLASWVKYMDADAFWMLVAQTTGWDSTIRRGSPWVKSGIKNLDLIAPTFKSNNIQVGAYIMSYYTPAKGHKKVDGYSASLGYSEDGRLYETSHVSLNCKNRFNDILKMAREFDSNPNVDFIGIDFIRTGRGDGYEMGPQVVNEMNIRVPAVYHKMSQTEKVKWFAYQIEKVKSSKIILKWRWWRAHRTAEIINQLITIGGITKPVWCFTLGWEHGKQHGQDPYMMFDAGAFIDAVMLYEASSMQFKNMMVQWHNYMRDNNNNVIIGNASDVRLLDGVTGNPAIEYVYRTKQGVDNVYFEGKAKGVFFHDLDRALWSSKRGIDTKEWSIVNGHAVSSYRYSLGMIPYKAEIHFDKDLVNGYIDIINTSTKTIKGISVHFVATHSWTKTTDNLPKSPETITLGPRERIRYRFSAHVKPSLVNTEAILGYYLDHPKYRRYFFFTQRTKKDYSQYLYGKEKS